VTFNVIVESVISLDQNAVKALDDADDKYTATAGLADTVEAYAEDYKAYTKRALIEKYVEDYKKDDKAGFDQEISDALWEAIAKEYAKVDAMKDFPSSEIKRYYKTALNNYEYDYNTSESNLKAYPSLEEYILRSEYGVSSNDVSAMKASGTMESEVRTRIEADAKEQIARKIVLFSLADQLGIEIGKAERRAAKEEIAKREYDRYYTIYKSAYSSMSGQYTEAQIEEIAVAYAEAASDSVEASLTTTYLREYATKKAIMAILVEDPVAFAEAHVTWTMSGEADKTDAE